MEYIREEVQEVKVTREPRGPKEDTRVTKGTGASADKEVGARTDEVTKGIKEEAKEGMEDRQVTKELSKEAKEGTKDGTREEVTREAKEEVKQAKGLSPTASGGVLNVEARVT